MDIMDVFVASCAKQRTYIEQLNFTPRNFTQKHLGTICGFFMVRDKSPWSAHIVHFLNAEFKKEYFSQPKRSLSESFTAALHHTNRALAELAKNDNINWIGMLDSVLCAYDETTIHFSVTGGGAILLLRGDELIDISQGLAPDEATPSPLKTFIDTASGRLIDGDKLILTSSELLDLIPFDELGKNLARFDDDEFFQFVSTVLTNECPMASTQIITVREKESIESDRIPQSHGIISDIDLPTHKKQPSEDDEIIIPQNAFSAKQYATNRQKESHYIPNESQDEKTMQPIPSTDHSKAQNNGNASPPSKKSTAEEYVDKRTGHIYVSGESLESSRSTLGTYLDIGKDFFADCLYNLKKWSRLLTQKLTHLLSQISALLASTTNKVKGLHKNGLSSLDTKSVDEVISDIPDDLSEQTVMPASEDKTLQKTISSHSSRITFSLSIFSKDNLLALAERLKSRVGQWHIKKKTAVVVRSTKKWLHKVQSKVLSFRSSSSIDASVDDREEQIVFEQDSTEAPEVVRQKKPTLWKRQEDTPPKTSPKAEQSLSKQVPATIKAQTSHSAKRSTPKPISDNHFSALDDLYGNEDMHLTSEHNEDPSSKAAKFFEVLLEQFQFYWNKAFSLVPQLKAQESVEATASATLADSTEVRKIDAHITGNRARHILGRFFPGFSHRISTFFGYIRSWKMGNYIVKILIGVLFVALIAYPLYKKSTANKVQEETVIAQEEKVFEENLIETVQEELTVPEPTKTVLDPTLVSADRGASHSILFKGTPFFAADTSLLSFSNDAVTTTPLPDDAGSIKHLVPIDDLSLIFFLTDSNLLYAYNPSTDIFTKQDITQTLDHTDIVALGSYQQKFYVGTNDGITRFDREIGGFDNATEWITDSTSISNLTSLAVDGSIFVAKDGEILKFEGGTLSPLSSPDNIQANFVYKTKEMSHLWVLDSVNFTIYKLDPETLETVESYVHEDLREVTSFSVDEEASIAYLTQDDKITSLSLVITQ